MFRITLLGLSAWNAMVGQALAATIIATSGTLPTHAVVLVRTLDGAAGSYGETLRLEGDSSLDTGLYSTEVTTPFLSISGEARAIVGIDAHNLLKTYSAAYGSGAGLFDSHGEGLSLAAWRDIAFVDTPSQPTVLRLNFVVDGTLAVERNDPNSLGYPYQDAGIYVRTSTTPLTFFASQAVELLSIGVAPNAELLGKSDGTPIGFATTAFFWDTYSFNGTTFRGTFHIDSQYSEELGGFGWGVSLEALAYAKGGSATTDFINTASLKSVTLVDGTPVSVTFDSGLRFDGTVTPEPTSLALAGCAGLGMAVGAWRRRRQQKSQAA